MVSVRMLKKRGDSMSKADMLFMERHCPECGVVKAVLNMGAVQEDDFRGRDGQELFVFSSQSPAATEKMMSVFGVDVEVPVLVKHDGDLINSPKKIVEYLQKQGMAS